MTLDERLAEMQERADGFAFADKGHVSRGRLLSAACVSSRDLPALLKAFKIMRERLDQEACLCDTGIVYPRCKCKVFADAAHVLEES